MNTAQFWQLEMQNQQNQQAQQQQNMQNIMGGLQQLAGAYSENKQLEAKASSYDDIGKILGTAMFTNNPDAMGALGNLQKEKDPRKKVMGYEQLFSLVGPLSNFAMANRSAGIREQGQQLQRDLPGIKAGTDAEADVAAGKAPYRPANRPRGVIPGAAAAVTPMPVISQNPNVFQQARMPFAGMGGS